MKSLLLLLSLVLSHQASVYPIQPRPLRKLILESEVVVYADVLDVQTIKADQSWNNTKATLLVREVLQGAVQQQTIAVFFTPGMACPEGPHYEKGTTVLAFLDASKHRKGYQTHALAYGSKIVSEDAYQAYKKQIVALKTILALEDAAQKEAQTLDWLVTCAVNPHTRWEGLEELRPRSDFMVGFDHDTKQFSHKRTLEARHKAALRAAFFQDTDLDYDDMYLLRVIDPKNDPKVLDHLIQQVEGRSPEAIYEKLFLLVRIGEFSEREDLKAIVESIWAINRSGKPNKQKSLALIKEFLEKL